MTDVLADNQFECVRGALIDLGSCLNIAAADEHVPDLKTSGASGQSSRECVAPHIQENAYQIDCRNDYHFSVLAK